MKPHKKLSNNDSALSPIIGEILIVAIAVILGAIIASYAFGTTKSLQDNLLIGMSVDKINEDNIVVTFIGGQDADKVLYLDVSVNGYYYNETTLWSLNPVNTFSGDGQNPIKVGKTVLMTNDPATYDPITANRDHVIIVAELIGGTQLVVLDTKV